MTCSELTLTLTLACWPPSPSPLEQVGVAAQKNVWLSLSNRVQRRTTASASAL